MDAAEKAARVALAQYRAGLTDFNRVALVEQNLVTQQDLLAQAQGDIALGLIEVYRALGGGWEIRLQALPGPVPIPPGIPDTPPAPAVEELPIPGEGLEPIAPPPAAPMPPGALPGVAPLNGGDAGEALKGDESAAKAGVSLRVTSAATAYVAPADGVVLTSLNEPEAPAIRRLPSPGGDVARDDFTARGR